MAASSASRTCERRTPLRYASNSRSITPRAKTASRNANVSHGPTFKIEKWSSTICARAAGFWCPWSAPRKREQESQQGGRDASFLPVLVENHVSPNSTPGCTTNANHPFPRRRHSLLVEAARKSSRCDESGRPGILRRRPRSHSPLGRKFGADDVRGEETAANLQTHFRQRQRMAARRMVRWSGWMLRHRHTPYSHRDGLLVSATTHERTSSRVVQRTFKGCSRQGTAQVTRPAALGPGEVQHAALRSEQTLRTAMGSVRCNRRIDSPGLRWIRRAGQIHLRRPVGRLPQ